MSSPSSTAGSTPRRRSSGERFVVSATVFREGPRRRQRRRRADRSGRPGALRAYGCSPAHPAPIGGAPTVSAGRGRELDASTSRRGATRSPPGVTTPASRCRPASTSSSCSRRAPGCSSGPAARARSTRDASSMLETARSLRDASRPGEARLRHGARAGRHRRHDRAPAPRPRHQEPKFPLFVQRELRALRQLVRVLPALGGCDREPTAVGHVPYGAGAAARPSPRWASTSSICRRSTRSARPRARARTTRSTPAPMTSACRGRSGRPTAGTMPSTRTSARSRTSTPSWPGRTSSGWRSRSTSRSRPRRTTRG